MYTIVFTKHALKDAEKIKRANLQDKVKGLLKKMEADPFSNPPPYEKLVGDLSGAYSRRINIQHRLVYQIYEDKKIIKIIRMWSHYE